MPTYHPYENRGGPDKGVKYTIDSGKIETHRRRRFFGIPLGPWRHTGSLLLTEDTRILEEHTDPNGNGWISFDNGRDPYPDSTFYVYRYAVEFIREVRNRALPGVT